MYKNLIVLFVIFFVGIRLLADVTIWAVPQASHNAGTAFSFPIHSGIEILLTGTALLLIAGFLYFEKNRTYILPVALLLAAGANNIFERMRYGAVIDPITIYNWQGNAADMCIALAVILVVWGMIEEKNI